LIPASSHRPSPLNRATLLYSTLLKTNQKPNFESQPVESRVMQFLQNSRRIATVLKPIVTTETNLRFFSSASQISRSFQWRSQASSSTSVLKGSFFCHFTVPIAKLIIPIFGNGDFFCPTRDNLTCVTLGNVASEGDDPEKFEL